MRMDNKKDQQKTSGGSIDEKAHAQVREALLLKKDLIMAELKKIDLAIADLQEEFSRKIEAFQSKRKPSEEALHHIEALLKLEGLVLNSNLNKVGENKIDHIPGTAKITDAAYDFLSEVQKPLHYKEIFNKLQEQGLYIPGKNPAATLLSRMSRDNRFKRTIKRGTYALSTWRIRSTKSKRKKQKKKKT